MFVLVVLLTRLILVLWWLCRKRQPFWSASTLAVATEDVRRRGAGSSPFRRWRAIPVPAMASDAGPSPLRHCQRPPGTQDQDDAGWKSNGFELYDGLTAAKRALGIPSCVPGEERLLRVFSWEAIPCIWAIERES